MKQEISKSKRAAFALISALMIIALLEVFLSFAYLMSLRIRGGQQFSSDEPSYLTLINIPYRAARKLELVPTFGAYEFRFERTPTPFSRPDDQLGYRVLPNAYVATFSRKRNYADKWEKFQVSERRNYDGTRWTGECNRNSSRAVHIFGDSWVAGVGVNDEQTFSYLFQNAKPDLCVKLHAVEGYGLAQALIKFRQLKPSISKDDIIILGYADYFDVRNVVAPSRLRDTERWFERRLGRAVESLKLPRISIGNDGKLVVSYVQQRCDENEGYCAKEDPSKAHMSKITAEIINRIAEESSAPVFLLHFDGSADNKALRHVNGTVRVISALSSDFDYIIQDDVMGFDPHPGPYWHYAISRKIIKHIQ